MLTLIAGDGCKLHVVHADELLTAFGESEAEKLAEAFLKFTDAEGYILAVGATAVNDALTNYIDAIDAFHEQAKFDNPSFTLANVKEAQASMREARTSLLKAIADDYRKAK